MNQCIFIYGNMLLHKHPYCCKYFWYLWQGSQCSGTICSACGFRCFPRLPSSSSNIEGSLSIRLYFPSAVAAAHRWSCLGLLPRSTVSQEGPKSKLLWGLCNGTVWEERRGPARVGPSPLMLRWLLVARRSHRQAEVQNPLRQQTAFLLAAESNPGGGEKNKHGRCALDQCSSTYGAWGPTLKKKKNVDVFMQTERCKKN